MRVTAKQLAEKAGVSQATVSLVLHGKPGVSEKVRRQVLALAEEMGLEPHTSAPASRVHLPSPKSSLTAAAVSPAADADFPEA